MPYTHIRPLGFGEILDGAFTLYRRHFLDFFLTTLIPLAPIGILYARLLASGEAFDPAAADELTGMVIALGFGSMLVMLVVFGALTRQAAQAYGGAQVSIGDGYAHGVRRALPLLVASIVAVIVMTVVWMALILGTGFVAGLLSVVSGALGMVAGVVLGVATFILGVGVVASLFAIGPAVIVEGAGPIAAVTRSWRLVRGARIRVVGVFFVSWLITALPTFGIMFALGFGAALYDPDAMQVLTTSQLYIQQAASTLIGALTLPFTVACMVLLYFDRRVRTEGYDVEVAAEALAPAE